MRGDVATPDDLEHGIGFLIGEVSRLMRIVYDRRVEPLGLTRSQWRVLVHLYRRQGVTQSELAQVLELEKATVGQLVDRLEAKGWVERRPDDRDARARRLFLPDAVRPMIDDMIGLADTVRSDAVAGLPEREVARLTETLLHIKANLARIADGGGRS